MRNTLRAAMFFLFAVLILGACGNSNKDVGKGPDEPLQKNNTLVVKEDVEGGTLNSGSGYGFNKFDLEIEVDGQDVVDAQYAVAKSHSASYENKLADLKLEGTEAFNTLDGLFMNIMLTKDTSKKDAIDKIMKWFGLDTYTKFDLEVDFSDGTKLDIDDRK
ncbi:YusW family protein [Sporosarcina thermotolerans]|uniref:YusW family protein n=1 Tax=Sporosarcina thermotolerans TaxID=633404 RepID=A0AAW9ACF0_9BACL|nr:YusW family protein [Sporosarcina thermotolerans]MDW0118739.1 YusW family protein [Sporosarcina thermotolerans]WHT48421.1 YusW family protein [Sporosarcina thermotolerans]